MAVEIGLFASEVLLTLPKPICDGEMFVTGTFIAPDVGYADVKLPSYVKVSDAFVSTIKYPAPLWMGTFIQNE